MSQLNSHLSVWIIYALFALFLVINYLVRNRNISYLLPVVASLIFIFNEINNIFVSDVIFSPFEYKSGAILAAILNLLFLVYIYRSKLDSLFGTISTILIFCLSIIQYIDDFFIMLLIIDVAYIILTGFKFLLRLDYRNIFYEFIFREFISLFTYIATFLITSQNGSVNINTLHVNEEQGLMVLVIGLIFSRLIYELSLFNIRIDESSTDNKLISYAELCYQFLSLITIVGIFKSFYSSVHPDIQINMQNIIQVGSLVGLFVLSVKAFRQSSIQRFTVNALNMKKLIILFIILASDNILDINLTVMVLFLIYGFSILVLSSQNKNSDKNQFVYFILGLTTACALISPYLGGDVLLKNFIFNKQYILMVLFIIPNVMLVPSLLKILAHKINKADLDSNEKIQGKA